MSCEKRYYSELNQSDFIYENHAPIALKKMLHLDFHLNRRLYGADYLNYFGLFVLLNKLDDSSINYTVFNFFK